jgi:hypothetical protein
VSFVWDLLDTIDPLDLLVSLVTDSPEGSLRDMSPKAVIVHHARGRVRLRVSQRRYDRAFFEEIKQRLLTCQSVQTVEVNPRSASVLILYEGTVATLLQQVFEAGVTALVEIEFPTAAPLTDQMADRLKAIDTVIVRTTHGSVDGAGVVVTLLLAAAGVELLRGRVFGAIPMLWYAGQAIGGIIPTAVVPAKSSFLNASRPSADQQHAVQ